MGWLIFVTSMSLTDSWTSYIWYSVIGLCFTDYTLEVVVWGEA